jgi:hypothetical protein
VQNTTPNVTAVTVPVPLDEKQQYWIVHAILMAIKQMVGEEELVNVTGNRGIKMYIQNSTIQFLTSYSNMKNNGSSSTELEYEENKCQQLSYS